MARSLRCFASLLVIAASACSPAAAPRTERGAPAPRPSEVTEAIRVGTSGDYPPLSLWSGESPSGFAPELRGAFAHTHRIGLRWSRFRWPDLLTEFRAGSFDVVADGITVRPERCIAGTF